MPNCSVFSCKKRSATSSVQKDNVSFHLFPKTAMLRDVWIRACANHVLWIPKRTSTICSQHFESSCFITQSNNKRRLKQCAMPTLELPKVDVHEESKPGTFTPKVIKVETFEDSLPSETQECETTNYQLHTLQTENRNLQLIESPREIKLKKLLRKKNKQIKRLQSQTRYLTEKVAELQETLSNLSEKWLNN